MPMPGPANPCSTGYLGRANNELKGRTIVTKPKNVAAVSRATTTALLGLAVALVD